MEGADLAAAVGEQLVAAHRAGDDLVDIFGRLVLAVDLLVLAVGELGGDEADMAVIAPNWSETGWAGAILRRDWVLIAWVLSVSVSICAISVVMTLGTRVSELRKFREIS
jgi:hypothetical protein